jgi:hypothetical protein
VAEGVPKGANIETLSGENECEPAISRPLVEQSPGQPGQVALKRSLYQSKGENLMLWTIVVILVILWLLGFFGRNISPSFPRTGSWIHTLIVLAVILIILNLLGVV